MHSSRDIDRATGGNSGETQHLLPSSHEYDKFWCSTRFGLMCVLSFTGFFNIFALRVNLNVALVTMLNQTNGLGQNVSDDCPDVNSLNGTSPVPAHGSQHQDAPVYNWDEGQVLGAFYYGFLATQILSGVLSEQIGGKILFGFGVLGTASLSLLTPLVASLGEGPFIALRVLEGLIEGVTAPALHAIWSKWAPPLERSRLVAVSYAGSTAGTVVSMPVSGLLCQYGFAGGWPSVFYVFGGFGVLWCVFWFVLASDSPRDNRFISPQERDYIEKMIGTSGSAAKIGFRDIPWREIAMSRPFWAICVSYFCSTWAFYVFLTCLPIYLKDILKYDISQSGILSSLPYVAGLAVNLLSSYVVDLVRTKDILTTSKARKIAQCLGNFVPAVCLVSVSYVGCNHVAVITLLCVGEGFIGNTNSGFLVNHLDIAPRYAGILMGISNTIGSVPGVLAPVIVAYLTQFDETIAQWQKVFYISMGVAVFGAIFFVIFAAGEEQEWAKTPEDRKPSSQQQQQHGAEERHNVQDPADQTHFRTGRGGRETHHEHPESR